MSKKNYGIPYKGSKNRIAEDIIDFLPSGKTLVDLFGGGGAITDCASKSGKWETVIYNEIDKLPHDCFIKALKGEFDNETRWISREDFFRLKDTDCYAACCFSFGNDFKTYMYSKEIEPLKKKYHECKSLKTDRVQNLERLERLQSLKRENLDNIIFYNEDYRKVSIPDNAIIYCDIPYKDTNKYNKSLSFDYEAFYQWCIDMKSKGYEVYISEYNIPDNRFTEVWRKEKLCKMAKRKAVKKIEKIYKVL